jgi:hypothetical protein
MMHRRTSSQRLLAGSIDWAGGGLRIHVVTEGDRRRGKKYRRYDKAESKRRETSRSGRESNKQSE